MTDWAISARRFVRAGESASLATASQRHEGYPFVSVVTYMADAASRPVILVSRLAEHTANLEGTPRASLMVQQPGADSQALGRVTLVCNANRLDPEPAFIERYVRYLPQAERLLALGDFHFVRLQPVAIRFIAGFGAIRWIESSAYAPAWSPTAESENRILEDLEGLERTLLERICSKRFGTAATDLKVLGVDCDGIELRVDGKRLRLDVDEPVESHDALITALESLV